MKSKQGRNPSNLVAVALGLLIAMTVAVVPAQASVPVTACGTVITQPGNYVLASNLNCTGDGIDINVANVSVSLAGYYISGPCGKSSGGSGASDTSLVTQGCSAVGINIGPGQNGGRLDHVAVQGPGLIGYFATGISISSADYSQISQVAVSQNVSNGVAVSDCTFLTLAANVTAGNVNGVWMDGVSNSSLSYNHATGNSSQGIALNGETNSTGNTLTNNNASGNGGSGIVIAGTGTRAISNTTDGNAVYGIWLSGVTGGNQVFNNTSAFGNGTADLNDSLTNCGSNFWRGNTFIIATQSCIN